MTERGASVLYWLGFVALIGAYIVSELYHLPLGYIATGLIVAATIRRSVRYFRRATSQPEGTHVEPTPGGTTMFTLCLVSIALFIAFRPNLPFGAIIVTAIVVLVLAGLALAVRSIARMRHEQRAFVTEQQQAVTAMATGDFIRAGGIYARWTTATDARVEAAAKHGLITVLIRRGEFDEAMEVLGDGNENWRFIDAALIHALRGDLDDAARVIDHLDLDHIAIAASTALARSIWNLRKGAGAKVATRLHEEWPQLESQLTAQQLRPVQIVRAFAEASDPRQAGVAGMSLANLRPQYPGEFVYLGKTWPEMAAFLAANDLD